LLLCLALPREDDMIRQRSSRLGSNPKRYNKAAPLLRPLTTANPFYVSSTRYVFFPRRCRIPSSVSPHIFWNSSGVPDLSGKTQCKATEENTHVLNSRPNKPMIRASSAPSSPSATSPGHSSTSYRNTSSLSTSAPKSG
jgi:hypothetical protein